MGISLLCLEEMNMCDENMNLEEQVTEPVEPKVETEPLFDATRSTAPRLTPRACAPASEDAR